MSAWAHEEAEASVESEEAAREHSARCGCRASDPDFYFDPAERAARARDR